MNYCVVVEDDFSSAHALRGYKGKCENLHGHNWKVKVSICGKKLDKLGMLLDFTDLKKVLTIVLEKLDHKDLGKVEPFNKINPTAENIAAHIFTQVKAKLKESKFKQITVGEVKVWESDTSCAVVSS